MTTTASPLITATDDRGPCGTRPEAVERRRPVGRQELRETLAALVDGARSGRGGAIVVRGASGSGKTRLLDDAVVDARDCQVLRSTGVEIESGLAFGTVQQLCGPLADLVAALPAPQATALRTALRVSPGSAPEPTLVGMALVSLLAAAASDRPVICLVDDAQWVDELSAQAIGVAARRLTGLGVVLLLASRRPESTPALAGLDDVRIHPLSRGEAELMLGLELPGRLDPAVRDQIVAEARGRPRVLRQLGRATSVTAVAGGYAIDVHAEVDGTVEASITDRLSGLPRDVSTALLLAAAEPMGDPVSFRKALAAAGLTPDVQRAAEATGLIEIGDRVLCSHPLVRHVVYRRASDAQRRGAHRILAETVDAIARPDHAAWHHGQAATGPSEMVAHALERWSGSALRAGGGAAAAAFLARAATLSEQPGAGPRRALEAARLHARSGGFEEALRLTAAVDHASPGESAPSTAPLVTAEIAAALGRPGATRDLLSAAQACADDAPDLSVHACLTAFDAAASAGRYGSDDGMRHVAAGAGALPGGPPRSAAEKLLQAVVARWSGGDVSRHDMVAEAVSAAATDRTLVHPMATRMAMERWDEDAWATLSRREVDVARRTGASAMLPGALDRQACLHVLRGETSLAASGVDEAARVARRTGVAEPMLAVAVLAGWQGDGEEQLERIDEWSRRAGRQGDGCAVTLLEHSRCLAHLAAGRYEQAHHHARRVLDLDESFVSGWAAAEVVEAAVRSGRPQDAAPGFAWVRSVSATTGSSWARGIEHRCRALLSEDDATEWHFLESVRHLERSGMRLDLARTHLLHGEWLRRQSRRVDARPPLRQALEVFDAAGAAAFAARTSIELRASGERARLRTPDTILTLTARESQVAELAIQGASNPDIGMQLFISARTVEYHLGKVFAKLGITSRGQLRSALQA